jgi:NAD(P)H-dependent FMN reductase
MIVVGSVRPGRIGLPIAQWVQREVEAQRASDSDGGSGDLADGDAAFDVDFVDLVELALPFMDEPAHPSKRAYTKQHTIDWSARVLEADAFIFVTPEYNHSYSPALKNALDFLFTEWKHKPVTFVSYGGTSGGTRGAVALEVVTNAVGLVRTAASIELPFAGRNVVDGVYTGDEKASAILTAALAELAATAAALAPLRA